MSQHRWRVGAYRQNYGQAPKSSSKPKKTSGGQPSTTLDQPTVVKQLSHDTPQPSSHDYTAIRSASCGSPQLQIDGYVKPSPGFDNNPQVTLLVRPDVGTAQRRTSGWQSMSSSMSSRTSSRLSLRYSSCSESDTSVEEWMPTPFSTTQSDILNVLSSRAMTPKAVRIFFDVIRPNAAVVHDVFNVAPIYTWDFTPDIAHSSVFYAASCVVQSLYDIALPSYDGNPSREVLIHKGRALTSLREELLSCGNLISDHLLMAVLYLCMFELQYGTAEDRKIHQNTLLQLIKLRGGLHLVGQHARAIISNYYFFSSIATGSNLIEAISGARFPSFAGRRMMIGYEPLFQDLPAGFRVLVWNESLSSSTLEAVLRINREHCRRHSAFSYEDKTIFEIQSNRLKYSNWWEALPSTLLPEVDGEVAFEKMLCMGLILFVSYFFSPDRTSSSTLKLLRGSLTKSLTGNVSFQDADQHSCAAWVWAVTIVAHIEKEGLNENAAALRTLMLKRYPELRAPKQAQEAFERYFHEEELVAAMQI